MNPTTITDQPIPLLDGTILNSFGSASSPDNSDNLINDISNKSLPDVITAQETESQSLDTSTKRIKGAYAFESLGSLKIGHFVQGSSGEIAISPNGITATNSNGDTTINLDGSDGEADFFGIVHARGFEVVDQTGLISLNNFDKQEIFSIGTQNTSSTSYVDVSGSSMNPLVLARDSVVLIGLMIQGLNDANITSQASDYGSAIIYDSYSAAGITNLDFPGQAVTYTPDGLTFHMDINSLIYARSTLLRLSAGTHNLKLQIKSVGGGNSIIDSFEIFYVVLGN